MHAFLLNCHGNKIISNNQISVQCKECKQLSLILIELWWPTRRHTPHPTYEAAVLV